MTQSQLDPYFYYSLTINSFTLQFNFKKINDVSEK